MTDNEERISLHRLVQTLRRYRAAIGLSLASIAAAYIVGTAIYLLLSPSRTVTTLPFRLQFRGAEEGRYPNGSRFSTADIVSATVLTSVYQKNRLQDYVSYSDFSAAVFVVESSAEHDRINREYAAKLADPKLPATDRDRLENEYRDKIAALGKFDYAVTFLVPTRVRTIPQVVRRKVLGDILATWAEEARVDKQVLQHSVAVFSPQLLNRVASADEPFVRRVLLLRQRISALLQNIDDISEIAGVQMIRTGPENVSLAEIRLELSEIARYDIIPLLILASRAGVVDREGATQVVTAQLEHDERALHSARAREAALRNTFVTYQAATDVGHTVPATSNGGETEGMQREAVMPQLTDSFLDRIVDLASNKADRQYRQAMIDDLKAAALAVIPAEAAVAADRALLEALRTAPTSSDPALAAEAQRRWGGLLRRMETAIQRLNAIHKIASRRVNNQTELFRVIAPATTRVDRATAFDRIGLIGLLVLMISLPVIIGACLLHNRLRTDADEYALRQRS